MTENSALLDDASGANPTERHRLSLPRQLWLVAAGGMMQLLSVQLAAVWDVG